MLEEFAGAGLDFLRRLLVEAVDRGNFVEVDKGEFLDSRKAFGGKHLADHFVDVERVHEEVGALVEFLLAALRFLGFRHDVDVPAGELRSQTHVLAATADGERQLLVRNDHFDALGILVEDDLG